MHVSSISQLLNEQLSKRSTRQEKSQSTASFSTHMPPQNNTIHQAVSSALLPFVNYQIAPVNFVETTLNTVSSRATDLFMNDEKAATKTTAYDSIIRKTSEKYNISENLIKAIIKTESNFSNDTVSTAGAQGLMQLMPGTASYLGVNDPFNPEQNIDAGTAYIRKMLDKYDGDITLALAAYNAGPGNVNKYGGVPPFKETTSYINKVLTAYKEFNQA